VTADTLALAAHLGPEEIPKALLDYCFRCHPTARRRDRIGDGAAVR
jgi:hypothetical protein